MNDFQPYELIESYLNGTLGASEHLAFEKQMEEDASLKKKVEQHQLANLFIRKNSLLAIKELVARENELAENKARTKGWTGRLSIALIAGLGLWWYFTPPKSETVQTTTTHQTIVQNITATPSATERKQEIGERLKPATQTVKEKKEAKPVEDKKEESPINYSPISLENTPAVVHSPVLPTEKTKEQLPANANTVKASPCSNAVLYAHVQTSPSCLGNASGSIHVSGFQGGTAPYRYQVIKNAEILSSPLHLASGNYSVSIQDAAGCSKTLENVWIKEQDCQTEFAFNPFIGDVWEIPSYSSKGTLIVYDELGNVYFRTEIAAEAEVTWSGYSAKGELKTGYFPFSINYEDGHKKQGSVSIGK